MMKDGFALVLSGGSVRGAAHIGVLKVLERYGLFPDLLAGTSAGAMVAALYGSGLSAAELEELFLGYIHRRDFLDLDLGGILGAIILFSPKRFRGLYRGRRLQELVAANLRHVRDFADYRRPDLPASVRPVFLTAVNLADGQETVFAPPGTIPRGEFRVCTAQSLAFAVRCSIGIPGTFVPAACEPRPGCPCYGRGTQYYVDGGVRDFYPITVPVRLMGVKRILGVELGYAGKQEDIMAQGPAELFGHILEIMGHDQVEADYRDHEVTQARVVTINPLIYDIGAFATEYIPALIARGEAVAEECFRSLGLSRAAGREENLARLFPAGQGLFIYPPKGSEAFAYWLAHPIKKSSPR